VEVYREATRILHLDRPFGDWPRAATASRRIDASGQVVAPGFIDIQSHSWDALLRRDGRVVGKVAQGVTTEILGESTTPAPVTPACGTCWPCTLKSSSWT